MADTPAGGDFEDGIDYGADPVEESEEEMEPVIPINDGDSDEQASPDEDAAEGESSEKADDSDADARYKELLEKVEQMSADLKKAQDALRESELASQKASAVKKAGLPEAAARFLTGEPETWPGLIEGLNALVQSQQETRKPIPRDPAADAEPDTGSEELQSAVQFLGI